MILQQGPPDTLTERLISRLQTQENIDILYSKRNIGCGGGRRILVEKAETPLIMTLDDDIYVTRNWIEPVIELFENHEMDAVGIPQYTPENDLLSLSGWNIQISWKKRVVKKTPLPHRAIKSKMPFIRVNSISGGVMIFRREIKSRFTWDGRYITGFDDLDKSLQIITSGESNQAVCLRSKVIHDQKAKTSEFLKVRWSGIKVTNSYREFINKWGLRLPLKEHIEYLYLYPTFFPFIIKTGLFERVRDLNRLMQKVT